MSLQCIATTCRWYTKCGNGTTERSATSPPLASIMLSQGRNAKCNEWVMCWCTIRFHCATRIQHSKTSAARGVKGKFSRIKWQLMRISHHETIAAPKPNAALHLFMPPMSLQTWKFAALVASLTAGLCIRLGRRQKSTPANKCKHIPISKDPYKCTPIGLKWTRNKKKKKLCCIFRHSTIVCQRLPPKYRGNWLRKSIDVNFFCLHI